MKQDLGKTRDDSGKKSSRTLSQSIFVAIGLAIIVGGIWMLYMSDAPYHPEDTVTRDSTFSAAD